MQLFRIEYRVWFHDRLMEYTYDLVAGVTAKEASSALKAKVREEYKPVKISIRTKIPKHHTNPANRQVRIPSSARINFKNIENR